MFDGGRRGMQCRCPHRAPSMLARRRGGNRGIRARGAGQTGGSSDALDLRFGYALVCGHVGAAAATRFPRRRFPGREELGALFVVVALARGSAMNRWLDMETTAADHSEHRGRRGIKAKFRTAFRGLRRGIRRESNFFVHLLISAVTVAAGGISGHDGRMVSARRLYHRGICRRDVQHCDRVAGQSRFARAQSTHRRRTRYCFRPPCWLVVLGAAVVGAVIFIPRLLPLFGWEGICPMRFPA